MSPILVTSSDKKLNQLIDQEKFKLRSPSKATQEEIDLTKFYIGVDQQLKQQKIIKQSVIKGRRHTTNLDLTHLPNIHKDLNLSNLTITDDQL